MNEPIVAKTIQTRRRVNLKQTASGKIYWDVTVEMYGDSHEEILAEIETLKNELERRYGE